MELRESGLIIRPRLVEVIPLKQGIRTVVTVAIGHPEIGPNGIFEYQHSTGENLEDSIRKGFDQWIQLDLITLLDALHPKPESCTMMEMTFPEGDGKAARSRRAVLGPVGHLCAKPPAEPNRARAADQDDDSPSDDDHPFCMCCFLTNTFAAFKEMIEGDGFFGIRFFASRDADGTPQADCRVNGEDWEPGPGDPGVRQDLAGRRVRIPQAIRGPPDRTGIHVAHDRIETASRSSYACIRITRDLSERMA